jgi:magnesium-protoporphyrin O-methyltransferase
MTVDPCCAELDADFDAPIAARDLAYYRRHGLPPDQRRLLAALISDGVEGRTVLDIGGGVGAIHHELLRAGARSITDVDASSAYLEAAREEARWQGDSDRIEYRHGDMVALADAIEPADVVILLRVLCCYRDMPALVRASTGRARRSYGVIYPRSTWWMRVAGVAYDALRPLTGRVSGPGLVHAERDVDAAVRREGFAPTATESTWFWRIAVYARLAPGLGPPSAPAGSA